MSKILIIENDDQLYLRLASIAEKLGYNSEQSHNAENALHLIANNKYFAVLVGLGTVNDIKTLFQITVRSKETSIVVAIGSERHAEDMKRALAEGIDDFIFTPMPDLYVEICLKNIFDRFSRTMDISISELGSFIDVMPTMMVISDGNGRIVYANNQVLQRFGRNKKDTIGKMLCTLIHCGNQEIVGKTCYETHRSCKIHQYENLVLVTGKKVVKKEYKYNVISGGKTHSKTIRVSMAPLEYDGRKFVIINLEDITKERTVIDVLTSTIDSLRKSNESSQDQAKISSKLAEYLQDMNDSLQLEKNKLSMLFENMPSGFLLLHNVDGTFFVEDGNVKFNELAHIDNSNFVYGKTLDTMSMEVDPVFLNNLHNVLESGNSCQFNLKSSFLKATFSVNMYRPETDYVAVLFNDITQEIENIEQKKELARQLKRQNVMLDDRNVELKKAIETKNKFISIIAHDLRNPFNAINGLSEILVKKLNPETEQRAHTMAKIIHDSAKGAYNLLENLLVWARTQQNTIQFAPEVLNIHSTVAEVVNEIKVQSEKKSIMLMNQTEQGKTIWADKQMLQTIIRNITSNAIKFTNEGGLVVISSEHTPNNTILIIEDNGVGMTDEVREKLLTIYKDKSTEGTASEKGSGMGLLISKEFVDRHKGTIEVESQKGRGTKFTITFPNTVNGEN